MIGQAIRVGPVTALILGLGLALLPSGFAPAAAAGQAEVLVTVHGADGVPLPDAQVSVVTPSGSTVASGSTGTTGRVSLSVPPGDYRVSAGAQRYFTQFYPRAVSPDTAEPVVLPAGPTTLPTMTLRWGTTISGVVRTPTGEPFDGVSVEGWFGRTTTDADGAFALVAPAGTHRLHFRETLGDYDEDPAELLVTVGAGHDPTGQVVEKEMRGRVSGTITGPDAAPLPGVSVLAPTGATAAGATQAVLTDADGHYEIGGLTTSEVRIRVRGGEGLEHRFHGGRSFAGATVVPTGVGVRTTGVDVRLREEAVVTGRVTVPSGVDASAVRVTAYSDDDRDDPLGDGVVAPDGTYRIPHLPAGAVRVRFEARHQGLATTWAGGASRHADADDLPTVAGGTISGVDVDLEAGGILQGTVSDGVSGEPVRATALELYPFAGPETRPEVSVWALDGRFEMTALSTGDYRVRLVGDGTYAPQWLTDRVAVTAGRTTQLPPSSALRRMTCTPPVLTNTVEDVHGRAVLGEPLSVAFPDWNATPSTVAVQWLRDGEPVASAAGTTYTPTEADLGARISARVRGTRSGYADASCDSLETDPTLRPMGLTSTVRIEGDPWAGQVVTATRAVWDVAVTRVDYEWFLDGVLTDQHDPTFRIPALRRDYYDPPVLRVRVTPMLDGYAPRPTEAHLRLKAFPNAAEHRPGSPRGRAYVGSTLAAPRVYWQQSVDGLQFQWLRDEVEIAGSTARTYLLTRADLGSEMSVRITPVSACCYPVPTLSRSSKPVLSKARLRVVADVRRSGTLRVTARMSPTGGVAPRRCLHVTAAGERRCVRVRRGVATTTYTGLAPGIVTVMATYRGDGRIARDSDTTHATVKGR